MSQPHILVVEDEAVARRVLHVMLTQAGYDVTSVGSGEEALEQLAAQHFDLLLTDLQLRKVDGVQVMVAARERDPEIEVIILTGYATLQSAIAAVQHGAHNYILKPGNPGEIEQSVADALAKRKKRVDQAIWLRRMGESLLRLADSTGTPTAPASQSGVTHAPEEAFIQLGDLRIDLQRHLVTLAGEPVQLSTGEFDLLVYMAQNGEQVVSPQQIVRNVLGYEATPQEARDLIKARIWALRRKIEPHPDSPTRIVSVRGVGYMLQRQPASTAS